LEDWESILLVSLEIGFRHLDPQDRCIWARLTHTEHHRELVDVVFKSRNSEAIADLLHAWTTKGSFHAPPHTLLGICTGHLVGLRYLVPFSPRLRRLVIRSVELTGYEGFEGVGVERFIELLNHLHTTVEDMDWGFRWARHLLDTPQSSEGVQRLSHWYWELLVELAVSIPVRLIRATTYSPQIMTFLTEAREWSKLEYWMGTVCVAWPPEAGGITEEDLNRLLPLLFRQRPGTAQKLNRWMERWSRKYGGGVPESFQRICKQAHEAAQGGAL